MRDGHGKGERAHECVPARDAGHDRVGEENDHEREQKLAGKGEQPEHPGVFGPDGKRLRPPVQVRCQDLRRGKKGQDHQVAGLNQEEDGPGKRRDEDIPLVGCAGGQLRDGRRGKHRRDKQVDRSQDLDHSRLPGNVARVRIHPLHEPGNVAAGR